MISKRVPRFVVGALALFAVSCGGGGRGSADRAVGSTTPAHRTTSRSVKLPYVEVGQQAACPGDAQTIEAAEDSYALLNGGYATMTQLVRSQYLRAASRYYAEVKLGVPAGGYTLVAVPAGPCANLPVAGSP